MKIIIFNLMLTSTLCGLQACGGGSGGSDSAGPAQVTSTVYSLTVTDINIVRTVGRQAVPVGPLPASSAKITVK